MSLQIVHISTSDRQGGSARSARRIHQSLRAMGHTSRMLVGFKSGGDEDVGTVHGGGARRLADRLAEEATRRIGLQYLWYPSGGHLSHHDWLKNADVIQIYNIHGGYLSHRLLPALAALAPVIWRLSDMWAVTGHCAYAGPCARWREGCGSCPDLTAYPPLPIDTTSLLWRIKRRVYSHARPVVVAPSLWLERIAKDLPLFAGLEIRRIPNGVDRTIFRPMPKAAAREVLGLPSGRKLLLFSAHLLTDNARKGSTDALSACRNLAAQADCEVVLLGFGGESWRDQIPQRVHALGFIGDDRLLAAAYAAADICIAPSREENLPNSILESLACGTPVVAYDAGGIGEAVRNGEEGLIAPPGDVAALDSAAASLLGDDSVRARMACAGVQRVAAEFDAVREARDFANLYTALAEARLAG